MFILIKVYDSNSVDEHELLEQSSMWN